MSHHYNLRNRKNLGKAKNDESKGKSTVSQPDKTREKSKCIIPNDITYDSNEDSDYVAFEDQYDSSEYNDGEITPIPTDSDAEGTGGDECVEGSCDKCCVCGTDIEDECDEESGFIDDSDSRNPLNEEHLYHMLQEMFENQDPFEGCEFSEKQQAKLDKMKEIVHKQKPTIHRILDCKMPLRKKMDLFKLFYTYTELEPNSAEWFMLGDTMHAILSEWETMNKSQRKEMRTLLKPEKRKSVLHQIFSLDASPEVKKGLISLYETNDGSDSTHVSRLHTALKIPFNTIKPIHTSLPNFVPKDKESMGNSNVKREVLLHVKKALDKRLHGMEDVKRQLLISLHQRMSTQSWHKSQLETQNVSTDNSTLDSKLEANSESGKKSANSFALLLNGPPGVGKTAIAHALAEGLGLYFYKIGCGNLDNAKMITGGESIWRGASISSLSQALIEAQHKNPIILLDEIDKNTNNKYNREVESALLQILDPTQNFNFRDLNMPEVPIDLSEVWFIATSNDKSKLSKPLLSRLNVIDIPAYTTPDLMTIVQRHIIPPICKKYRMPADSIVLEDAVLKSWIQASKSQIDEFGVRHMETVLQKIIGECMLKNELESNVGVEVGVADEEAGVGKIVLTSDMFASQKSNVNYSSIYL